MSRPTGNVISATDEHFARYYGGVTVTGQWVGKAKVKGRLVAAFGGAIEMEDGTWFGFIDVPAHEKTRSLYRHALDVINQAKAAGAKRIKATCDTRIDRSEALMKRMGFVPTDEKIDGMEVWVCQVSN